MHATVSKQKFDYSFLYLIGFEDQFSATEDTVVHLNTLDVLNVIGPVSEVSSSHYSNNLKMNSV